MAIIQVYGITIEAKVEEVDECYDLVQFELDRPRKQDVLLVIGDSNWTLEFNYHTKEMPRC